MTQNRKPIKGSTSQADTENLYRGVNEISAEVQRLSDAFGGNAGGADDTNPFTVLAPCSPFVIDSQIMPGVGEEPICCVNFPNGTPAVNLKTVLRMYKKNGITLQAEEKKFYENFGDITDLMIDAGIINYPFGRALPFNRRFALWQLIMTDENGHKIKARDETSTTPLATFETGNPGLGNPAAHQLFRNGRFERSLEKGNPASAAPNRATECWAWFRDCDRTKPITTSTHPTPSGDPNWEKFLGYITHSSGSVSFSQRLPHRILRANDIVHVSGWIQRLFAATLGSAINATLNIDIVSVNDTRSTGGSLSLSQLTTVALDYIGTNGIPPLASPAAIIGDPIEVPLSTSVPFQAALQVPATYAVGQTLEPTGGAGSNDSSGQWIRFRLTNITGVGRFKFDRMRAGYGDGDWTPHPDENGDTVGGVDITGGGPRGGGDNYAIGPNSSEPLQGGILRPRTD